MLSLNSGLFLIGSNTSSCPTTTTFRSALIIYVNTSIPASPQAKQKNLNIFKDTLLRRLENLLRQKRQKFLCMKHSDR